MRPARLAAALSLVGAALGLAGCGAAPEANRIPGKRLVIYLSGPLHGASNAIAHAQVNAARLALAEQGARVGKYLIELKVLDDSTPQSDGWDPNQTILNARLSAQDPAAIGYLGELNSGATAISIPVLNRAGIAQVSPSSGAVGLTSQGPGASPGEPEKYYPTGVRTFARVVPSDAVESEVEVSLEQSQGCKATFVLQDGEVDGSSEAITFALTAQSRGLSVLGVQAFVPHALDYTGLASSVAQSDADCVLLSALDGPSAARLARELAVELPNAKLFASSTLAQPSFTQSAKGGLAPALDSRVLILSPALGGSAYPPPGRAMLAAYARQFGPAPPQAVFGYTAMSLMLDAIRRATDNGRKAAQRSKVVAALFARGAHQSVLGPYGIDANGDTTLGSYGIYRVMNGRLVFLRAATG
jgi:branched-chain amino acid transport system substrate-binding protein